MGKEAEVPGAVEERRYLTDNRDLEGRYELVVGMGGNGDWYVAVVPEGTGTMGRAVRICTSGGAQSARPGMPLAIKRLWDTMKEPGQ